MLIFFSVHFNTQPGQDLYIKHSPIHLGDNYIKEETDLEYGANGLWTGRLELPSDQKDDFVYEYVVRNGDGSLWHEAGAARRWKLGAATDVVHFNDQWTGNTVVAPFLSAPFTDVFYAHQNPKPLCTGLLPKEVIIKVHVPVLEATHKVYLCGSCPVLGSWDPGKALLMNPGQSGLWWIAISQEKLPKIFEYKFICDRNQWETGDNKKAHIPELGPDCSYVLEHALCLFNPKRHRFAGCAVPVFSLRSKKSWGIGDFSDLTLLIDWIAETGQKFLQLLPINDTYASGEWTDSYPYKAISVTALHPMYISPKLAGKITDKSLAASLAREARRLNALEAVDYEAVNSLKFRFLIALFAQEGHLTLATKDCRDFIEANSSWLLPYAAFCTLRDQFQTADFKCWKSYATFHPNIISKLYAPRSHRRKKMDFYIFTQYLLHVQLAAARDYAHKKGIALKGDIPIGISPQSVEAWVEPYYFNMNGQAGAPPDDFSADGQNWGFPTYRWDAMAHDGYRWWKQRFTKMAEYFDAYRIDHVLGFFRIWEIPMDAVKGVLGHFSPALPYTADEWRAGGFPLDFERHAKPYIRYYMLREMFGDQCPYVMENFLDSPAYEVFTLKNTCNTQRKIQDMEGVPQHIKDGLMALCAEVLVIQDPMDARKFHPRISAQFTYSYKALPQAQQDAFNRLYDEFFYRRHNAYWKEKAMHKLPEVVAATNMLSCAEDLGMIPDCVPELLRDLRILTLEVQRMPKDVHERYGKPWTYPYLSVCTSGSHDTSTLRGWWEEERDGVQYFYNHLLGCDGAAPERLEPWVCERIVRQLMESPSMLCLLPLQDWMALSKEPRKQTGMEERINEPANPHHYWRWRMAESIEDLAGNTQLTRQILDIITETGR